jgi:hypothetical protein
MRKTQRGQAATKKDKMMDDKIIFHHFVVHYFVFQKSLLLVYKADCLVPNPNESETQKPKHKIQK